VRLDFNVLWVDDQPQHIDAQIKSIARQMEKEGFQFNPLLCKSIKEVRELTKGDVFNDEVDLILVDWDLGKGAHGEEVIAAVRQEIPYKDVVFYSAQTPADTLRKLVYQNGIEGVFCVNRGDLVNEVTGVFDSLVKKVLDLDHTRGIVMGATSDIDQMVNECLIVIHGGLDEPGQTAMIAEAFTQIDKKLAKWTTDAAKLRKKPTMATIMKANVIFSANDRLVFLAEALEKDTFKMHAQARESVLRYKDGVVPKRNRLGHLVLHADGKPKAIAGVGGRQVNIDEMRELRRSILGLRQDFRNLRDALRGQGDGGVSKAKRAGGKKVR
jgi:hypothetical protein